MSKAVVAIALAAIVGSPAYAGTTEQALARCTAAAEAQAPTGATVSRTRIVEGGRATRVSFVIKGADRRKFDCSVGVRGELVAAYADARQPTALANAD